MLYVTNSFDILTYEDFVLKELVFLTKSEDNQNVKISEMH